jgi:hypothetical protein
MFSWKRILIVLFSMPLLTFSVEIQSYYWKYNLKRNYYILYLKFKRNSCPQQGNTLIFITSYGRIYKKTLKKYTCFVKKYFKNLKSEKILVLIFDRKRFDVKKIGVLKTPLSSN